MLTVSEIVSDYYRKRYAQQASDRNSLLNPEVLFQHLSAEAALLRALRSVDLDWKAAKILDVGTGDGGSLVPFTLLGVPASQLVGIDREQARIDTARKRMPGVDFRVGDAARMAFADQSFDVVMTASLFLQDVSHEAARSIGTEINRVLRDGGYVVASEWGARDPRDREMRAVTLGRLTDILGLPLVCTKRASIIPPIGRRLSKYAPALYFMFQWLPFGRKVYVFRKSAASGSRHLEPS